MKERTFVIFRQVGTCAMNDDPVVGYVHGTNRRAQEITTYITKGTNLYHYYMDLDDLKEHGDNVDFEFAHTGCGRCTD